MMGSLLEIDSPMDLDRKRRQQNIDDGNELCEKCSGTGNQLYSFYQRCSDCAGTGIKESTEEEGEG